MGRSWMLMSFAFVLAAYGAPADDPPLSPFGIGSCYVNNRSVADNERWVPQMSSIGLSAFRTPHADWGALEPAPGRWDWGPFDEQTKYLERNGFEFGCLLI